MGKVLITYYSRTGKTEKMAEYIAEGIRFSGNSAEIRKLSDIGTIATKTYTFCNILSHFFGFACSAIVCN